jgi:polypeptide N-acetylgalactosaminyltransferase
MGTPVIPFKCHGLGATQLWSMSVLGEIRKNDLCLDYSGGESGLSQQNNLIMYPCHSQGGNQKWYMIQNGLIKHEKGSFCVEISADEKNLWVTKCDATNQRQMWTWSSQTSQTSQNPK